ncbi:protein lin-37 homolog [Mya arenaria]|uniref:protein lin-37 homolog n=1 Tax=Mya arenaria TaxID=6604 RepID=UPI0022DEA088|nr:protein lin-37 homolog [Mya arenaria]
MDGDRPAQLIKKEVKVSKARYRLDATLQSLVDKKEDSSESEEESDDDVGGVMVTVPVVRTSGSPAASPSKRGGYVRAYRKRKRKHATVDSSEPGAKNFQPNQSSYIMKLFDRTVDLAQFNEKTPLYPIARAWMNNSVSTQEPSIEPETDKNEPKDPSCLYKMPLPLRLKVETGASRNLRIPAPIPQDDEPLDINKDPDTGPPPEQLLLRHLERWKAVRESWIEAAHVNELRFNNSMTILKDMYERNLNDQNFE